MFLQYSFLTYSFRTRRRNEEFVRCVSDCVRFLCWRTERDIHSHTVAYQASHHGTHSVCLLFACSKRRETFRCFFLLTLSSVRAHPSVKLGTFTRLDTKTAHSKLPNMEKYSNLLQINSNWLNSQAKRWIEHTKNFFDFFAVFWCIWIL